MITEAYPKPAADTISVSTGRPLVMHVVMASGMHVVMPGMPQERSGALRRACRGFWLGAHHEDARDASGAFREPVEVLWVETYPNTLGSAGEAQDRLQMVWEESLMITRVCQELP